MNMYAIRISVNKQMDGLTFSITPSLRAFIKKLFPNSHPANRIFVAYDTKSDFEDQYKRLETYIYPALLGLDKADDLKKINEIEFIDTQSGAVLHKVNPSD
jgi:hypothetical protein